MAEIRGTIAEIRFRNEENGYTIATIETDLQPYTVVGVFPPVGEGGYVYCSGNFVEHARYGRQLKADTVRIEQPDTIYGILRFLGSGMIKGIGEKRAAAIVEKFGKDTFTVIENTPSRLTEIKGISPKAAASIAEAYGEVKSASDAMSFLMGHGISSGLALKIYNEYGKATVATVSYNPYRLTEDVSGVGFLTADRIASGLGISPTSDFRIRAALIYTLTEAAERSGNTLLPRKDLAESTATLLKTDCAELIDRNIDDLILARKLRPVEYDDEEAVMTAALYKAESRSAVKLCRMAESANRALPDCTEEIAEFERIENVTFHSEQREAISSAISSGVSVITGGPGTGKTTIVRCILRILTAHGLTVKLMAPTGRAAKRLSESTGEDASTIHRALLADEDDETILGADAVIVDEFSMVDVTLLSMLLNKLRDEAKLVIVGDADQLPSVGAGNVLADIINSGVVPVARLTRIYRQDERSNIVVNAHRINRGELPDLRAGGDFFFIHSDGAADTAKKTVELVTERLPAFLGCSPQKIQVLCPMKGGEAGCVNLNKLLRTRLLGRPTEEVTVGEYAFAAGDKVMHVVNNYNLVWTKDYREGKGVFNGDMGTVTEVSRQSGEIRVAFEDGRSAAYTGEDKTQLMPAYAITVHKSQGSEYEGVVIPLCGNMPLIMTRNLLYTAITRAKNLVVIVGAEDTVRRMVRNDYIQKRFSKLGDFLTDAEHKMSLLYSQNDENDD